MASSVRSRGSAAAGGSMMSGRHPKRKSEGTNEMQVQDCPITGFPINDNLVKRLKSDHSGRVTQKTLVNTLGKTSFVNALANALGNGRVNALVDKPFHIIASVFVNAFEYYSWNSLPMISLYALAKNLVRSAENTPLETRAKTCDTRSAHRVITSQWLVLLYMRGNCFVWLFISQRVLSIRRTA